ncbi:MAG: hypothetical protein ACOVOQ_08845 [Flavobacterium sp.]|jgi:hypothetical protein
MTKFKRKKKITDFDYDAYLRDVEQRLIKLDYKGIIQDTFEQFIVDDSHRNTLEKKNNQAKNN